jgi:hypothetical protein
VDHYMDEKAGSGGPLFNEGPFSRSLHEPSGVESVVGQMIWKHKGHANPLSISKIQTVTGYSERDIKKIVEQLVVKHKLKIGGNRQEPWGYFIAESAEDLAKACEPFENQILAMWRRLRVLKSPQELREMLGQLKLEETTNV